MNVTQDTWDAFLDEYGDLRKDNEELTERLETVIFIAQTYSEAEDFSQLLLEALNGKGLGHSIFGCETKPTK